MWQSGSKKTEISRALQVDYDVVLDWCKRFKADGEAGQLSQYHRCGRRTDLNNPIMLRAIALRKEHATWGAEYIRLQLQREFPQSKVVQANQIRRWIKAAGLVVPKTRLPAPKPEWVNRPLQRVQVDANEQLQTKDGQPCCYLTFTDEHSGAVLDGFVFPPQPDQPGSTP
jgi:transposase